MENEAISWYNVLQSFRSGAGLWGAAIKSVSLPGRKDEKVYRFKGFDSAVCGGSMAALEALVNTWMDDEHPRIRHMSQSIRGEDIVLSFVYEDARELEQRVSVQSQRSMTGSLPRIFDDDADEHPTSPRIPATPPAMH